MLRISVLLLALTCAVAIAGNPDNPHGFINVDCNQCHTTAGWGRLAPVLKFDHGATAFPLGGRHGQVACIACHTSLVFAEAETHCLDCHLDVHQGQFANACETCHSPDGWAMTAKMEAHHQSTRFPLVGVHARLDCQACHANGQYTNLALECSGCHLGQYLTVVTPDHAAAGFPHDCNQCHTATTTGWQGATFEHSETFPLTQGHAVSDCNRCHAQGYGNTGTACYPCHTADYEEAADPNHVASEFPQDCATCHTSAGWSPATFDHNLSRFPLTGAHVSTDCAACHVDGRYTGTTTDCNGCHAADYQATTNPNHAASSFPSDCAQCHTTTAWRPAEFDHNLARFPLTGAHLSTDCAQCHVDGQYTGTTTVCVGCHAANYDGSANPPHVAGQFPLECEQCHGTQTWQPSIFNHTATNFPLTGRHVTALCTDCHVAGQWAGTAGDCYSCHRTEYEGTAAPDHEAGDYPHHCNVCHSTDGWTPAVFDHNNTAFPLTGAHVTATCTQCHVNEQYAGTPTACFACHEAEYRETNAPDHEAQQFPQDCAICHSTAAWQPSTFDHSQSDFPLTGRHVQVNCTECHVGGQYNGTPTDCWACHESEYQSADEHAASGYPHECAMCHSTNGWEPSTFDHDQSDFPLTGRHVAVNCAECHIGGVYDGTPTDCWSCHQQDYQDADDHVSNNYPHDCTLCHNTEGWDPSTFDHNHTNFLLTGAHITTQCTQCHVDGQYQGTPTDCWSCHQQNYQGADDHANNNYPHDCTICHSTAAWEPSTFDHDNTDYPLTGRHRDVNCAECHVGGQYEGTPTDCWSCHEEDYNDAEDHSSGNYPHDCTLCHNTGGWENDVFDHGITDFPLTGAHVAAGCAECHIDGQFDGTPTDCFFCHETDYNDANDPDHQAAQFPTTCGDCHNTMRWDQATFNHDGQYFPIYSGRHRETWTSCAECHPTPGNFADFTCVSCHAHRQSEMDNEHDEVQNYVYESRACLNCHPDGGESPRLRRPRNRLEK